MGQSRSVGFFSDSDFHGREGKIPNLLAGNIGLFFAYSVLAAYLFWWNSKVSYGRE